MNRKLLDLASRTLGDAFAHEAPRLSVGDKLRELAWRYNADRMVADYVRHGYLAAGGRLSSA